LTIFTFPASQVKALILPPFLLPLRKVQFSQNEETLLTHRHCVCAQFAAIGTQVIYEPGKMQNGVKIWQGWQEACQKSTDVRHTAM